nr:prolyl oligopeptidase family serine peptidase [Luteimonas sp. MHLX1A]
MLPLDGGEARQVGGSQRELQALMQWSPDGRRVLLSARTPWSEDADDATDGSNRPWVVTHLPWKLDGSGPQVGHRTVLLAMDVDSGDEQILVCGDFDVVEAAWSPDGKSLAYVRTRDGSQRHRMDLWLADGDGGNARLLTDGLASIAGITWSPDGRTLALGGTVTEGDSLSLLWLVDIADGSLRRPADELQLEGSTIVWHPDGDRVATLAARRGLQEVVVVDVSSGAVTRVDDGLQHAAALCAAGDGLVFARAGISAPVINMESHSGTSDSGYYVDPYSMDGEVDDAHERYRRLSPLSYADDIRTPTLLLQGEDDQRCPLGQSEELLARLVRRSKAPARMVVYPGGTHLLAGTGTPSHRVDYHRRLSRWLRGALD